MTEKHKRIIKSNFDKLVNLNAGSVMVDLVAKDIFTFHEQEHVNAESTSQQKANELLTMLVKKQDRGFYVLIAALEKRGNPELARILERAGEMLNFLCI